VTSWFRSNRLGDALSLQAFPILGIFYAERDRVADDLIRVVLLLGSLSIALRAHLRVQRSDRSRRGCRASAQGAGHVYLADVATLDESAGRRPDDAGEFRWCPDIPFENMKAL
jgi:hypothetical protein